MHQSLTYPSGSFGAPPPEAAVSKPVIRIVDLCKSFGSNKVLQHFSLTVRNEENVVVLGRSGVGKSVLIKCIIGLLRPEEGQIHVLGEDMLDLDHDAIDKVRARIGFLFQSNALYDSMTVRANLEFPLRRHWIELSQQKVDDLVREVLDAVGLAHTAEMMPEELSGGMRKRIALAWTLILKPEIILYDEPTTGLDPITGREISHLIKDIQHRYHTASIIISHDMHCVRLTSDRIVVLHEGRSYAEGTYDQLSDSKDALVHQFFE